MNLYKKFLRNFIFMTLAISFLVVTLCCVADPYEIWHFYNRQGFNLYSVKGENIERLTKPLNFIFHQRDAQALFIGSSRVDYALSPKHWEKLTGRKTYNFAVTSAVVYEMRRYIEYAAANDKNLEEIILCLDFFVFLDIPDQDVVNIMPFKDEKQFEESLPSPANLQKVIFSWNALKDSFDNCKKNHEKKYNFLCHDLDGKFSESYIAHHYSEGGQTFLGIFDFWKTQFTFSERALKDSAFQDFQKIIDFCTEKNIKLHVCILPLYPLHYECFNECWEVYENWKIRLASIVPIYDFTCFDENLIRQENFWDTSHAKLIIGDKILNSIYSGNLEFGEIVTPENVRRHNAEILQQRNIWREKNI